MNEKKLKEKPVKFPKCEEAPKEQFKCPLCGGVYLLTLNSLAPFIVQALSKAKQYGIEQGKLTGKKEVEYFIDDMLGNSISAEDFVIDVSKWLESKIEKGAKVEK